MTDLFSPLTVKGVTLRNRIGMSPMTMYRSVDGRMDDFHVMHLGARAAGGFGLVFAEQVAITPEGRTSVSCAGIWDDEQIDSHRRVTALVDDLGAVPAIQLGHTGRCGSERPPWIAGGLGRQLPPDDPEGWQVVGPSNVPYGFGGRTHPVHALSVEEIGELHRSYAAAARRALAAGYRWLELHFAHGYLGASFYSPLANQRTDAYGGSLENRARFLLEALDAVRMLPEDLPLTARLGCDDFHPDGIDFEESVEVIGWLRDHGLDMIDLSMGGNTNDMRTTFYLEPGAWVERGRGSRPRWAFRSPSAGTWAIPLTLIGRSAQVMSIWCCWAAPRCPTRTGRCGPPVSSVLVTSSPCSPRTGPGGSTRRGSSSRTSAGHRRPGNPAEPHRGTGQNPTGSLGPS